MRIIEAPSLSALTTLGLGGTCQREVILEEEKDLERLSCELEASGSKPYALGLGSNILGLDGHHDVLLIKPALKGEPKILSESGDAVLVRVQCGQSLPSFLGFCKRNGLSGLEGLSGIPGSVGGACAMNAGSFGANFCDALASCTVWQDGSVKRFDKERIAFGYRHFMPQGLEGAFFLVLSADLLLHRDEPELVANRMEANLALKKSRQPVQARSAGCVFKNPPGEFSAGRLLDAAGFKGRRLGGVAFSEMHANFLVNTGAGTAAEAARLLRQAREAVKAEFGIELEYEVRTVPAGAAGL